MDAKNLNISDIKKLLPDRPKESHKGMFGKVFLIGGSLCYSGAIRLSDLAYATLRSGAGLCTISVPKSIVDIIAKDILEATIFPLTSNEEKEVVFVKDEIDKILQKADTITCGMGFGQSEGAKRILEYIVRNFDKNLILDADALNILSNNMDLLKETKAKIVLTPHKVEFMRLCKNDDFGNIEEDRIGVANEFAKKYNVVLLLKGSTTIITNGEKTSLCERGSSGMATAGSGDVLSGILSATVSFINNLYDAVCVGAYINGMAGEIAANKYTKISMIARDTIESIPLAVKRIYD